MIGTNVGLIFV